MIGNTVASAEYKAEYTQALAALRPKPPTLFVTLAYNLAQAGSGPRNPGLQLGFQRREHPASARRPLYGALSPLRLTADLRRLDGAVHARMFGRNYYRLPFERRLFWIAVREGGDVNPHVHMAWWVPGDSVLQFARLFGQAQREDVWRDQTGSGSSHVRVVDGGIDWVTYMLKNNPHLSMRDDAFYWASQFWPDTCRPTMAAP